MYFTEKSTGSDLELAAGSHKHQFPHMLFCVLFIQSTVKGLSLSPSLPADHDINALCPVIMCVFGMETRFSCSILVVNISVLYCRLIHFLYDGTDHVYSMEL